MRKLLLLAGDAYGEWGTRHNQAVLCREGQCCGGQHGGSWGPQEPVMRGCSSCSLPFFNTQTQTYMLLDIHPVNTQSSIAYM